MDIQIDGKAKGYYLFAVSVQGGTFKAFERHPGCEEAIDHFSILTQHALATDRWPHGWLALVLEVTNLAMQAGTWWAISDQDDTLIPVRFDPFADLPLKPMQEVTETYDHADGRQLVINTRPPTIKELTVAEWCEMNRQDFDAFGGAAPGSRKAELGDFMLIWSPGTCPGESGRIEAHGVIDGNPVCYAAELSVWQEGY